ncbi:hypothetical protein QJS04_geneDACA020505 [Acorus gramineus]|uniref:Uncharacterized protein n=1 Tax=Acorus gramineus TaxID=55184 RepID=A0AAV9AB63_ACOGR|nr:hypothetical protein QJS04_geneDACA020505 [Acorus gramineus]
MEGTVGVGEQGVPEENKACDEADKVDLEGDQLRMLVFSYFLVGGWFDFHSFSSCLPTIIQVGDEVEKKKGDKSADPSVTLQMRHVYTWRRRRRVDKEEVKVSRMFASRKSLEWEG